MAQPNPNPQPHMGPVIGSIQVVPIIWGDGWPYDGASPLSGQLFRFLQFFVGPDNPQMQQLREYSVNGITIEPGTVVGNKMINAPAQPPPPALDDTDIGKILTAWSGNPGFPSWGPNTAYMLFLPQSVGVTMGGQTGCQGGNDSFTAYHSWFDHQHCYIVIPCCLDPTSTSYPQAFNFLTTRCSHELCELITNPFGDGWVDDGTNPTTEISDFCSQFNSGPVQPTGGQLYQVEPFWSQQQQNCVFGPPVKVTNIATSTVIYGGQSFGGVLTLSNAVPVFSSGVIISLTSDNPAVTITTPSIRILPAVFNAAFLADSTPVAQKTVVSLRATLGSQVFSQQITVLPPAIASFSYTPAEAEGYQYPPNAPKGSLTLNQPAPQSGLIVGVTSSEHLLVTPVPDELPIAAGALSPSAPFYLQVNPAGVDTAVTLTADVAGASVDFVFHILPGGPSNLVVKTLTLDRPSVSGGETAIGTFTLASAVGPAGGSIVVESSDPSIAMVPGTVAVRAGGMGGSFQIHTKAQPPGSPRKFVTILAGKDGAPAHALLTVT